MNALRAYATPALLVWLVAGSSASASGNAGQEMAGAPRFKLFASSHSTAVAEVLAFHGVKKELPQVVLVGGLEGCIYRCDCGKNIHLWDVAVGTKRWARAEGLKVNTEARVLRGAGDVDSLDFSTPLPLGEVSEPSASRVRAAAGTPSPQSSPTRRSDLPDAPMVRFHKSYRQAIDANQPLVLTYSLDEASAKGMQASFLSQERVSVVGVGYDITSPEPYVIALLPEESNRDQKLQRLIALPGAALDKQGRLLRLPWNLLSGNLIATFIEVAP